VRLISARTAAGETLGVVVGDGWRAAAELLDGGPRTMADLLAAGPDTLIDLAAAAASATNISSSSPASPVAPTVVHVLEETDLLAPLPRPGKVVAIGRNYREHADEEGVDPPPAPLVFAKWPSSVVGPNADIRWDPALTQQVDYEAELAVVIGRTARNVSVDGALDHVFGYTCLDDVSARDIQFGDGQWVRGKSLDTFCPMGPWLVTADEIPDPQALAISCRVNDEVLQDSHTSRMYFGVAEIISYVSRSFTLEPGDVIATGTPGGVGVFRDPPRFLGDGDVVTVEIERIGRLVNTCRFEAGAAGEVTAARAAGTAATTTAAR
jgi:2-keto-4-pentenoate hydratase/2-oxohepta-3-ene-1,7-dioic acid hydratase in catechol pathway